MIDRRSFLGGAGAALALAPVAAWARRSAVEGAGLSAPLEIVDDVYGVPHIRAATIPDAFFGQGYVVARDRLFQIDFGHRRELGRMAEAFGADFARFDAVARLFHYRGDLDAELARAQASTSAGTRASSASRAPR
ncbi:MAG: hypothetical protein EOP68_22730 [Sphingomonas sp.]|nr:MAG: hypothetical protein EOP68_22730 [Sphingomonas sp.]